MSASKKAVQQHISQIGDLKHMECVHLQVTINIGGPKLLHDNIDMTVMLKLKVCTTSIASPYSSPMTDPDVSHIN